MGHPGLWQVESIHAAEGDDGCSVAVGFFRAYAGDLLEAGEILRGGGDDVVEDGVGEDDEGGLAGLGCFCFAPFAEAGFEVAAFSFAGCDGGADSRAQPFFQIVDALHAAQQRLSRDINPKVFSAREWKVKLRGKNPFVLDVLSKKKIFLVGDENGLTELGRNQS